MIIMFCVEINYKYTNTLPPSLPTQPICDISASGAEDVEVAIQAAQRAFDSGPWRTMNARDRGKILYRSVM